MQPDFDSAIPKVVFGYVLAGGGSRRFGRDKALVEFDATPLLLRTAALAAACSAEVHIVASSRKYAHLRIESPIVEDQWPGEGPLGGIITALQRSAETAPECQWNLVLGCDMPFLTLEWLEFLVSRARKSAASVVLPRSAHGLEPLCACYRTAAAPALRAAFDGGIRKVTEALKRVSTEVLDEPVWKRFDSAGRLFWNMNTPADFAYAQRLWETQQS